MCFFLALFVRIDSKLLIFLVSIVAIKNTIFKLLSIERGAIIVINDIIKCFFSKFILNFSNYMCYTVFFYSKSENEKTFANAVFWESV